MAKNTNRPKAKNTAKTPKKTVAPAQSVVENELIDAVPARPAVPATPPVPSTPRARRLAKVNRSQIAAERLEDEYAYIIDDLRRVFLLAALMFALLIVANLIFTRIG